MRIFSATVMYRKLELNCAERKELLRYWDFHNRVEEGFQDDYTLIIENKVFFFFFGDLLHGNSIVDVYELALLSFADTN